MPFFVEMSGTSESKIDAVLFISRVCMSLSNETADAGCSWLLATHDWQGVMVCRSRWAGTPRPS